MVVAIDRTFSVWGFDLEQDKSVREVLTRFICDGVWRTNDTADVVRFHITDVLLNEWMTPSSCVRSELASCQRIYLRPAALKLAGLICASDGLTKRSITRQRLTWLRQWDDKLSAGPTVDIERALLETGYLLRCLCRYLGLVVSGGDCEMLERMLRHAILRQPTRTHPLLQVRDFSSRYMSDVALTGLMYSFASGGNGLCWLASGWWQPEPWGSWSRAGVATVELELAPPDDDHIVLSLALWPFESRDKFRFSINDEVVHPQMTAGARETSILIPIDIGLLPQNPIALKLGIEALNAKSPMELGINSDERKLGIGLKSLVIQTSRANGTSTPPSAPPSRADERIIGSGRERGSKPAFTHSDVPFPIGVLSDRPNDAKSCFSSRSGVDAWSKMKRLPECDPSDAPVFLSCAVGTDDDRNAVPWPSWQDFAWITADSTDFVYVRKTKLLFVDCDLLKALEIPLAREAVSKIAPNCPIVGTLRALPGAFELLRVIGGQRGPKDYVGWDDQLWWTTPIC